MSEAQLRTTSVTPAGTERREAAGRHLWEHFTDQSKVEAGRNPVITKGEGVYFWDDQGNKLLDGLSGLFVVQAGYGREELAEAAAAQAKKLSYFPVWGYAHEPAIDLAEKLAGYAPEGINRVFFTTGGSEAVETAWKLAKQYWELVGKPDKKKVISRNGAYHGTTQGALALTQINPYRVPYQPLVPGVSAVPNTNSYRAAPEFWDNPQEYRRWLANELESAILAAGPDTVAAFFFEPIQNSGGCFVPPEGYFADAREICDKYDVLLVSDEVITAYGRTGDIFAGTEFGFVPDIITSSKGLTSGYSPLGAVLVHDRVYEPFRKPGVAFSHGYTFGGHPVSAAVALANLEIFENEGIVDRVHTLGPVFKSTLDSLYSLPIVGDIRGIGYFWGIELTRDPATREPFTDAEADRIRAVLNPTLYEAGLYCRADDRGDVVIQIAPPLISGQQEFQAITDALNVGITAAINSL